MVNIQYKGESYIPREGESLLKMFLRRGVKVPYSCGGGSCHSCMHRCVEGEIPERAQKGLRPVYKDNHFFLLCCCVPSTDMRIELPRRTERFCQAEVLASEAHEDGNVHVDIVPYTALKGKAGQYLLLLTQQNEKIAAQLLTDAEEGAALQILLGASSRPVKLAVGDQVEAQGPFVQLPSVIDMEEGIERKYPEPDPALWAALDNGKKLTKILNVFYHRVFRDPLLAPFFEAVTERRLVEKQYNFLSQIITGEKVYFGEKPRNLHHWMVISDDILDHRMQILHTVLMEFSLPMNAVEKLVAIEDYYRKDIVKDRPWEKVLFGKALPAEGYEPLVLDQASLCDGCESGVEKGEAITYHIRTGKVYCRRCRDY